jgi:phospholipid N-methyltransferase
MTLISYNPDFATSVAKKHISSNVEAQSTIFLTQNLSASEIPAEAEIILILVFLVTPTDHRMRILTKSFPPFLMTIAGFAQLRP